MKIIITLFLLFIAVNISFAQDAHEVKQKSGETVSTVGYIEKAESKQGYGINGFYIQLTKDEYEKYYDRKLEVTGEFLIARESGADVDMYYIKNPQIKILE